jgi:HJR/Mrr/RecB family endonuclease
MDYLDYIAYTLAFISASYIFHIVIKYSDDISTALQERFKSGKSNNYEKAPRTDKTKIPPTITIASPVYNETAHHLDQVHEEISHYLEQQAKQREQQEQECREWTLGVLKSLEWKRYEELCVEYLIEKGCKAEATSLGADGGIDIKVFEQDSEHPIAVAQCKAWGTRKVKVDHVRALFGVMAAEQVPHGIYLTTSDFTSEAQAFAEGKSLQLITGTGLIDLIRELSEESQQRLMDFATQGDYTTPTCARCGTKMVLRESKKDQSQFWGCLNYPRCRMTINLRRPISANIKETRRKLEKAG